MIINQRGQVWNFDFFLIQNLLSDCKISAIYLLTNPRQQVARGRVQEAGGADDGLDRYPAGGGGGYLADDPGRFAVGAAPDDEQGLGRVLRGHDDEHLAFVGHLEDVQAYPVGRESAAHPAFRIWRWAAAGI